ncbi:hypothetical protein HPB51_011241 [Rhipicephalus microplus]|uniref:Uncharacterized protein n=1 Tax=Rhipicephalus microplus TaxID=6941 RepID=A0A9J6F1V9_RHIMP|nr:hypothetical protein HPB51_011241 [Rhipicephalus microplus]
MLCPKRSGIGPPNWGWKRPLSRERSASSASRLGNARRPLPKVARARRFEAGKHQQPPQRVLPCAARVRGGKEAPLTGMAAAPAAGRLRLASNHVSAGAAGGAVGRGPIRPLAARPPPPPLRAPSDSSDEDYRECCCLTQCIRTCNAKQVRALTVCTAVFPQPRLPDAPLRRPPCVPWLRAQQSRRNARVIS